MQEMQKEVGFDIVMKPTQCRQPQAVRKFDCRFYDECLDKFARISTVRVCKRCGSFRLTPDGSKCGYPVYSCNDCGNRDWANRREVESWSCGECLIYKMTDGKRRGNYVANKTIL
jgi:hypothetical protein